MTSQMIQEYTATCTDQSSGLFRGLVSSYQASTHSLSIYTLHNNATTITTTRQVCAGWQLVCWQQNIRTQLLTTHITVRRRHLFLCYVRRSNKIKLQTSHSSFFPSLYIFFSFLIITSQNNHIISITLLTPWTTVEGREEVVV